MNSNIFFFERNNLINRLYTLITKVECDFFINNCIWYSIRKDITWGAIKAYVIHHIHIVHNGIVHKKEYQNCRYYNAHKYIINTKITQ